VIETLKNIKALFPDAEMMIITPDRSEKYLEIVAEIKAVGFSGIWRKKPIEETLCEHYQSSNPRPGSSSMGLRISKTGHGRQGEPEQFLFMLHLNRLTLICKT
jgi:hypothetical protein